jgi:hypothetical protein
MRIFSLEVFAMQKLQEFIAAAIRGGGDGGYVG